MNWPFQILAAILSAMVAMFIAMWATNMMGLDTYNSGWWHGWAGGFALASGLCWIRNAGRG